MVNKQSSTKVVIKKACISEKNSIYCGCLWNKVGGSGAPVTPAFAL